jgi:hypothetical protein
VAVAFEFGIHVTLCSPKTRQTLHVFVEKVSTTSSPTTSREELYPSSEATTLMVATRLLNAHGRCASWSPAS